VASQEAIKMLGTNGGGFFNANSAHPYENPTPFSNLLQMLSIFIIPAGLTYTLGRMTGSPGHGWAVLAAMFVLFAAGFTAVYWAESQPHPLLHGAAQTHTLAAPGGNMEGKEVRNGIAASSLFATITTDASCGAVNGMHDSFTPLGGMVVLINLMFGEVVFGGVGSGMYGMLIMVVLSVFIAGLMVGRTPEYLGKKIESYDMKMTMLYVLIFPLIILTFTAIFVLLPNIGLSSLNNAGPHGFTEILYAFTSAAANNGSAFAGLNANTWWYNVMLGCTMLGRGVIEAVIEGAVRAGRPARPARRRLMSLELTCRFTVAMTLAPECGYRETMARLAGHLLDVPWARRWHVPASKVLGRLAAAAGMAGHGRGVLAGGRLDRGPGHAADGTVVRPGARCNRRVPDRPACHRRQQARARVLGHQRRQRPVPAGAGGAGDRAGRPGDAGRGDGRLQCR
jgi:hypothetical protein